MKQKIVQAAVYALATLALANFFDSVYGAGPVTHYLALIHIAIAGTVLFAIACVCSLVRGEYGVICGLIAAVACWPYLFIELTAVPPWKASAWLARARDQPDTIAAIVMLILSTIYSLIRARKLHRTATSSSAQPPRATTGQVD